MEHVKKLNGRPALKEGKRTKFINVRFTETEYAEVAELENQLGISKTNLIRLRVLSDSKKVVINARELIRNMDGIGAEMGRIGNNINQLARHANTLNLKGQLSPVIIQDYKELFEAYITIQQSLEVTLRKIIRAMGL